MKSWGFPVTSKKQSGFPPRLPNCFRVRDEIEDVHKYLTLGQVTATLFILCTCLFLVSTVRQTHINKIIELNAGCGRFQAKNAKQLAAEMVYMVAMCFQLVLYCWFGNEVLREVQRGTKIF